MFKKIIKPALLIVCLLNTKQTLTETTQADDSTPLTTYILNKYLNCAFSTELSQSAPAKAEEPSSFIQNINKKLKQGFQILEVESLSLTPAETQRIAFDIVTQYTPLATTIIDTSFIDKLEIVQDGDSNSQRLLKNFFNSVHTSTGKASATLTLCHPTTDIATLTNRQRALSNITNNNEFVRHCTTELQKIARAEEQSLQHWHDKSPVNPSLLKNYYFGTWLKSLNTQTVPLEAYNKGGASLQFLYGTIGLPALNLLLYSYLSYKASRDQLSTKESLHKGIKMMKDLIVSPHIPLGPKIGSNLCYPMQLLNAYQAAMLLKNTGDVSNHLQKILINTATHVNSLKKLSSLVNKNKQLVKNLPSLQPLADFNNPKKHSKKLNKLLGMLNTNTFKGNPSFWSVTGRILAAYELMAQVKDELVPVFAAAGELDMYVAVAKLYKSREDKETRYCMVNFIENSSTPVIDAHNFWNPFINPDTVVVNSARLDYACQNSILTGPNTGGKSTVIKGIMLNILMAQTFGIAPAESLTLTPFSKLNCFMNISDDIATGASLFKSEVMRAKKLLDMVQDLKQDEFSFVIIDEIFTGTSPQEGEIAALRFAEKLGSYSHNTSIIATHYPKMAKLEEKTNGMFHNHHVEIIHNEDGSLNRTFKLKNGPSFFNVAFDILEEEGLFV